MELKKGHNPMDNKKLLYQNQLKLSDLSNALSETLKLFHMKRIAPHSNNAGIRYQLTKWRKFLFRPFLENCSYHPSTAYYIGEDGIPYPMWKKVLDWEESILEASIRSEVNVEDFGAIGDGETDNTEAFRKAIGNGYTSITVPPGIFLTKEIKLPSWTIIRGSGKNQTVLKLHNSAPKRSRLITNHSHRKGNHHIKVEDLSLDWNMERLKKKKKTNSGNNFSSCLTYANVTAGWVKRVAAINPGLHCFDVSSTLYTYGGDGTWGKGASKYIWFDQLTGSGFGDDGVTTHHSEHILISNCHMSDPSGKAHKQGSSNSNGFEIDDGSRGVWLIHNSSTRCFGGVEIKAHQTASAAANTFIIGHLSVRDNRSFNFRHIGHHLANDMASQTAYDIVAVNLQAWYPVRTDLYKNSAPRALVVSAYRNVVIHTFTAIGKANYGYRRQPVVAIQYRARNIFLLHFRFENFITASSDIEVFGGSQRADALMIHDVISRNSAPTAVRIGRGVKACKLTDIEGKLIR